NRRLDMPDFQEDDLTSFIPVAAGLCPALQAALSEHSGRAVTLSLPVVTLVTLDELSKDGSSLVQSTVRFSVISGDQCIILWSRDDAAMLVADQAGASP